MLSQDALQEIQAAKAEEVSSRHALLTALRVTQRERRRVGPEEIEYIAGLLELSPAIVQGVARFYDQISLESTGRHVVSVCRGISCYLSGCDDITQELCDVLGLSPGASSPDGRLTLRLVECIGDCNHAPAAILDDQFVGPLTTASLPAVRDVGR